MSEGYASRLSEYPNKGVVGLPESYDSKRQLKLRLSKLGEWVRDSKHLVVLTGAGISTSAGIPDFRGPRGIWTLEKKKNKRFLETRKRKRPCEGEDKSDRDRANSSHQGDDASNSIASMDFSRARPTLTHRAITYLAEKGRLKYCITQNVDGLHRRAGLSRDKHSALHGCAFTEKCHACFTEYFRDKDVGGMSFQPTGNKCEVCPGALHDTLLDWEDALPEEDFERAQEECDQADLVLCLGTSLRIEPAGSLPLRAKRFVIVNLQETPKDQDAAMIIKAKVDDVMESLMQKLGYSNWKEEAETPVSYRWTPSPKEES